MIQLRNLVIKLSGDFDLNMQDIQNDLKNRLKMTLSTFRPVLESKGRELAAKKLSTGLKHWDRGFSVNLVDENTCVCVLSGKLANWMESGMQVGDISKAVLANAKKVSKSGAKYADIPFIKEADSAGFIHSKKNVGTSANPEYQSYKVHVSAFKDADSLSQAFSKAPRKTTQRVQNIIKSTKGGKSNYLTIRRVSSAGKPWPSSPTKKAEVFEDLARFIDDNISDILERFM